MELQDGWKFSFCECANGLPGHQQLIDHAARQVNKRGGKVGFVFHIFVNQAIAQVTHGKPLIGIAEQAEPFGTVEVVECAACFFRRLR